MSGPKAPMDPADFPKTSEDLPLFDRDMAASDAARDEAMAIVEANAAERWKTVALRAVRWVAQNHDRFTSRDVGDAIALYYPDAEVHDARAMGPVMRRAKGAGIMEPTGDFVKDPRHHSTPIRVWRSLIYPRGHA